MNTIADQHCRVPSVKGKKKKSYDRAKGANCRRLSRRVTTINCKLVSIMFFLFIVKNFKVPVALTARLVMPYEQQW